VLFTGELKRAEKERKRNKSFSKRKSGLTKGKKKREAGRGKDRTRSLQDSSLKDFGSDGRKGGGGKVKGEQT